MTHPYCNLPSRAFWRTAVADKHFADYAEISEKITISPSDKVATAGSCFAQHIGRALRVSGMTYMDMEPAPAELSGEEALRHGFNTYSCRYGNVYTVRQLRQLAEEALGERKPVESVWQKDGRYRDALRPSLDPVGHDTPEAIMQLRKRHLRCVRDMLAGLDVFVFTLGLTESWQLLADATAFPICPGTDAGTFDKSKYGFINFRYPEIFADLVRFRELLKSVNSGARMLLTISPVPLTATASGNHVLSATIYSKSTLRAVAGDMAAMFNDVDYFPSYEIIASHPMRGGFFNPDLRTVNQHGVDMVMRHFFAAIDGIPLSVGENYDKLGIVCDEEKLEEFAK